MCQLSPISMLSANGIMTQTHTRVHDMSVYSVCRKMIWSVWCDHDYLPILLSHLDGMEETKIDYDVCT